jgi:glutathione S-transferase
MRSADWLDGGFSAGDLMMVSVLLRLKTSGVLDEYPNLAAYVARRCTGARDHMDVCRAQHGGAGHP